MHLARPPIQPERDVLIVLWNGAQTAFSTDVLCIFWVREGAGAEREVVCVC